MMVGRRPESSTFSTVPNAAGWVGRAWTAPMKKRCRLPSVQHWGCAEDGKLPPTRGVGRSSGIVQRLRSPLNSFFSPCNSCMGVKASMQKYLGCSERSHGRSIRLHRGEFHRALPSQFHRMSNPSFAKEARGAGSHGRCEYAPKRCFSVSRFRFSSSQATPKKSLPRKLFPTLTTPINPNKATKDL